MAVLYGVITLTKSLIGSKEDDVNPCRLVFEGTTVFMVF
jgi:hypothetical protein